jgi:cytochrome b involved in lipid metabolism
MFAPWSLSFAPEARQLISTDPISRKKVPGDRVLFTMKILGTIAILLLLAGCSTPAADNSATEVETQTSRPDPNAAELNPAPEDNTSAESTEATEDSAAESQAPEPSETKSEEPAATSTPKPSATSKPTASPKPTPEPTVTAGPVFVTKAEVAKNNSRSSCWVIIDGSVFDLTKWIAQHPGGSSAILNLCGGDGTDAFSGMHGGEARPSSTLQGYFFAELEN